MKNTRKDELLKVFQGLDNNILTIVTPMIDELVFIEGKLNEFRTMPFIKCHPNDPSIQKSTPAYRVYKDLQAKQNDIVRILCSQLHKTGAESNDSDLRKYLKELGIGS